MSDLRALLSQHPRGVTLAEIAAHLEVTPRSARRYLNEIRRDLEPVQDRGEKRWRIPPVDLPRRVAVRRTQAYALLAARPLFETMRGSAVYEEIAMAAESLIGVARRAGRGPNAGVPDAMLEQRFRYVPFAPKDYSAHSEELDNLFQAVADLHPIDCLYPDEEGNYRPLVLHPYALVLYKEAIYALGLDTERGDVCAFELDLLREARCIEDERFELPDGFSVDDYVQGQFGLWRNRGSAVHAVIDFDPRVASQLATRRFHPSQRLEPLAGGGVRMHLSLGDVRELEAWVLGFGPLAVVREPASLREQVQRSLAAALAGYERERRPEGQGDG